ASLPAAVWQQHAPPLWAMLLALAGTLWLLLPAGFPSRWAGLVLMLPVFLQPPPAPAHGGAWITTLDVGQGLAAGVHTANRTLLYDTGPMLGPEIDSGERIVVPYLRSAGVTQLEAMVVSHNDLDHSGGAISVLAEVDTEEFISSLAKDSPELKLA